MAAPTPSTDGDEFKWLASMDSESVIRTMKQLDGRRAAGTTTKRTPRKRTKTAKAAEMLEALAEEPEARPSKRANTSRAGQAPLFAPAEIAQGSAADTNATPSSAVPSLFKPSDPAVQTASEGAGELPGPSGAVDVHAVEHAPDNAVPEVPPSDTGEQAPEWVGVPPAADGVDSLPTGQHDGEATEDEVSTPVR
jgi:hypothetical protein